MAKTNRFSLFFFCQMDPNMWANDSKSKWLKILAPKRPKNVLKPAMCMRMCIPLRLLLALVSKQLGVKV